MYVIWRSGLQPGRLLHITHILFSGAATDGSGTACGFYFERIFFMNKKAPTGAFLDGRLFLRGKTFVREPAAATPQFSSKTTEFREKFIYNQLFCTKKLLCQLQFFLHTFENFHTHQNLNIQLYNLQQNRQDK